MIAGRESQSPVRRGALVGVSLVAMMWGGAAAAQAASDVAVADVGEVVVTGSRIQRDGFQAPTPVTVVAREQLADAAPTSIPEALNQLPQLRNSARPASAGPSANANAGGNYLNLRALGISRTLVLLDGRRAVPSNSSSATDINLVPQALISRVDIVTGGASAAYGSDAVAGVVNFVLDTDFTGWKGEVQGGVTKYGDDEGYKYNLTHGRGLFGDRGHIVFSLEYSDHEGVQGTNGRKWAEASYGPVAGLAGSPTTIITPNASVSNSSYGGLITSGPLINQTFLPGGGLTAFNFGTERTASQMIGGDGPREIAGLPTSLQYGTAYSHFKYRLTDNVEAFVEGAYSQSITRFFSTNLNTSGGNAFTIFRENAFLPAAVRNQLTAANVASFTLGKIPRDWGRANFHVRNIATNFTGGLKADLGGTWKADAYYERGETTQRIQTRNNFVYERVYRAADAVFAPNGSIVCRSTLTTPGDGCVPLNVFGENGASPEAINYITETSYSRARVRQDVVSGQISGDLFELPAGPLSIAAGAEYRKVSTRQISDAISQSRISDTTIRGLPATLLNVVGGFSLTNPQPNAGRYNIKEGFAEVAVPVLRDAPFAKTLDVSGAVRYTDYSISGGVTTWKVGGAWEPVSGLRFRTTRSRDIRAANFGELFAGTTQSQGLLRDPLNPAANGGANANVRFFSRRQGNANLTPEIADTLTAGFTYQPSWFAGFSLAIDVFKIDIEDAIALPSPQEVVNACFAGSAEQCALVTRTPAGVLQAVTTPFQNAASIKLNGADIEFGYRREVMDGNLTLRLLASTIGRNETTLRGATSIDRAGDVGNFATITNGTPRWTGNFTLAYDRGPLGLFVQERFISKSRFDHTLIEGLPAGGRLSVNDNSVPRVFYTDVTAKYKFEIDNKNIEAYLTVNNLFNKAPPVAPSVTTATYYPTNVYIYDMYGRYYVAGLRFQF